MNFRKKSEDFPKKAQPSFPKQGWVGVGGSKAAWSFYENSSKFETRVVPKAQSVFWWIQNHMHYPVDSICGQVEGRGAAGVHVAFFWQIIKGVFYGIHQDILPFQLCTGVKYTVLCAR